MCCSSAGALAWRASTRSPPTICFWTARPRSLGEHVVGRVQEVEHLGYAHVGDGLVDDLLGLDRGDADRERGAEHHPVLGNRLAGDHRGQLDHQPGPAVEPAVLKDLVEGEVVEVLDQLRVGDGQRRDAAGEQLVMVLPGFRGRHDAPLDCYAVHYGRTRRIVTGWAAGPVTWLTGPGPKRSYFAW